ncbi:hypothetical protein KSP40_PGU006733 [Platanthera guangdongensis]|uniref:Transcription repressor n=1 Tax=Platanthera guangdongensis TaxID=2320717 RepID=A0ABR2LGF1_9ASPA
MKNHRRHHHNSSSGSLILRYSGVGATFSSLTPFCCFDGISPQRSPTRETIPEQQSPPEVIRAAAFGRFFTSLSTTRSILEEAQLETRRRSSAANRPSISCLDSVPVVQISGDPSADFRLSMQEMVAARLRRVAGGNESSTDWEFLKELLLCYLELNEERAHEFILVAFFDLIAGILPPVQLAAMKTEA